MQCRLFRTRWAAVGAAVAVTLGGGGIAFVDAAKSSGDKPVTVLLDKPCRMRDTRASVGIGGRTTPLGPGETYTIAGRGPSGQCNVPADAVGLVMNVTALNASTFTNLQFFPAGSAAPGTSNLNPQPGGPPTPNSVTVGLNGAGQFSVLNAAGTVNVIIDVAAYLVDHNHDDRYYTKAETDSKIASVSAPASIIMYASGAQELPISSARSVRSVSLMPPSDGKVVVNATAGALQVNPAIRCSITTGSALDFDHLLFQANYAGAGALQLTGTRGFEATGGVLFTVNLVCDAPEGIITVYDSAVTAIFVSNS